MEREREERNDRGERKPLQLGICGSNYLLNRIQQYNDTTPSLDEGFHWFAEDEESTDQCCKDELRRYDAIDLAQESCTRHTHETAL